MSPKINIGICKILPIHYQRCAFITNAAHSLPMLPIYYQCYPFITNVAHSLPMLPIHYQMLPIHYQCCPFITNVAHSLPMLPIHTNVISYIYKISLNTAYLKRDIKHDAYLSNKSIRRQLVLSKTFVYELF